MSTKVEIPSIATKKCGNLLFKTIVYPKYKKTYIYIFVDDSLYTKYLSKLWLAENMLAGTVGRGVLFIGDEKLITDYIKSYCKYLATKIVKSVIPNQIIKYEPIKFNKIEVDIFGKCKTFVRAHMMKESKKLTNLNEQISKIQIKERSEVRGTNKATPKYIQIDFNKKILVDLAIGYWDVDFTVLNDKIVIEDVVSVEKYNSFKQIVKSFKTKVPSEELKAMCDIMAKVHGITGLVNLDLEMLNESAKVSKRFV